MPISGMGWNMYNAKLLIQASSISWAGGKDLCMALVEDETAVERTIKKSLISFPDIDVVVIAPEFDKGGSLDRVVSSISNKHLSIYYGHNASPLMRMLDVCSEMDDDAYIIRVDGLHFSYDTKLSRDILDFAINKSMDCVKLPDDFPIGFSSEVFRVGALRKLAGLLKPPTDDMYHVHPKHYFFKNRGDFKFAFYTELPAYTNEYLAECRLLTEKIYETGRSGVSKKFRIASGDTYSFHYELACKYIRKYMKVLDIACGEGYGVHILSPYCMEVHGADLDEEAIKSANEGNVSPNAKFFISDVTNTSFDDNSYDAVTCFETLEHVPEDACLRELTRILKPGGVFVLSTPQNSHGHIPLNSGHIKEYPLSELVELVSKYFIIVRVIGIKAGVIYDDIDPYGTNTVLICIKPNH